MEKNEQKPLINSSSLLHLYEKCSRVLVETLYVSKMFM